MKRSLLLLIFVAACAERPPKTVEIVPREDPQAFRRQRPAPGPTPTLVAPTPDVRTLANGLTVMVVPDHRLPVISARMVFKVGSAADPKGREGLASFMAGLLESGTTTRDVKTIAADAERLGSSIGVGLDGEVIEVQTSVLTQNFPSLFPIFTDVIRNTVFPEDEIERTRRRRLLSLRQEKDSPTRLAWRTLTATLYGDHPYGHTAIGTAESIPAIQRRDLVEFHSRFLRPERAALILTGDIDPVAIRDLVDEAFGDWPRGDAKTPPIPEVTPGKRSVVLVNRPGAPRSQLVLGHVTIPRGHPDYFALLIANAIFGGQFNSRINLNLREGKGVSYGASSSIDFRRGNGPFAVSTAVRGDATGLALREIIAELERLRADGVSDDELRNAKDNFSLSLPGYFQTRGAVARILSNLFIYDLPLDYYQRLPERLAAITRADVQRAAREHLLPEALNVVVIGDRSMVEEDLRASGLGEVEVREGS